MTLATGICSTCSIRKALTASGVVKLHVRHGSTCGGSMVAPRPPASRVKPGSWSSQRAAVIERDERRCRKCRGSNAHGLDVHHKLERVYGGTDDLENLIALCSLCHNEWTNCEPPAHIVSFDAWLALPPMRHVLFIFSRPWPEDVSAAAYKAEVLATLEAARIAYEAKL